MATHHLHAIQDQLVCCECRAVFGEGDILTATCLRYPGAWNAVRMFLHDVERQRAAQWN